MPHFQLVLMVIVIIVLILDIEHMAISDTYHLYLSRFFFVSLRSLSYFYVTKNTTKLTDIDFDALTAHESAKPSQTT